jgi:hypothetical protein
MDVPYWTGKSCTSLLNPPYYGGWKAKVLLMWLWPVYIVVNPFRIIRQKLIAIAKKNFSSSTVERIKKLRGRE